MVHFCEQLVSVDKDILIKDEGDSSNDDPDQVRVCLCGCVSVSVVFVYLHFRMLCARAHTHIRFGTPHTVPLFGDETKPRGREEETHHCHCHKRCP